jgi:hypothetical protein
MKSGLATVTTRESLHRREALRRESWPKRPIEITACYHEFGSKLIFGSSGPARKLLIRKEFWLRGKDLNLRPLGYEFDLCFVWFRVVPSISMT